MKRIRSKVLRGSEDMTVREVIDRLKEDPGQWYKVKVYENSATAEKRAELLGAVPGIETTTEDRTLLARAYSPATVARKPEPVRHMKLTKSAPGIKGHRPKFQIVDEARRG